MIKILRPNENPFKRDSKIATAWKIVRGYGGCSEEDCIDALCEADLARRTQVRGGNRGYLREFHRRGLMELPVYEYSSRKGSM